ncbi:MAG TPA: tetratricopeptide repeat protein [Pyrinomonadaceae bacterium]|nr:tetratricopeptide repeat protein [Pyrinomonadaceae bacterium]
MRNYKIRVACLTLLVLTLCFASTVVAVAQTAAPSAASQEADALFKSQKWADVARAYEGITKVESTNGRAWYRLGVALHNLGRYAQAVEAYQKAMAINKNNLLAMYNLACSYARMNDKDKAFEWLNKAYTAGYPQFEALKTDPDLASLRDDPRFPQLVASAEKLTMPCMFSTEARQFDFWVGEWDVQLNGQQVGTSSVQRILNGCVVFENWASGLGGTGKSFNFYDSSTSRWQQTYVDSTGTVLNFYGEYRDNALRYTAETHAKDGSKTLHKLTFFNLGPQRVRQLWEQSTDDGKTWNTVWDGIYIRKQ